MIFLDLLLFTLVTVILLFFALTFLIFLYPDFSFVEEYTAKLFAPLTLLQFKRIPFLFLLKVALIDLDIPTYL